MNSYDKDTWNVKSDPFAKMNKSNKNVYGQKEPNIFDMPEKEKKLFSQTKDIAGKFISDENKETFSTFLKNFSEQTTGSSDNTDRRTDKNRTYRSASNSDAKKKGVGIVIGIIFIIFSLLSSLADTLIENNYDDSDVGNDGLSYTEYYIDDDMLNSLVEDPDAASNEFINEFIQTKGYVASIDRENNQVVLVPYEGWSKECAVICKIYDYTSLSPDSDNKDVEYISIADIPVGSELEIRGFVTEIDDVKGFYVDVNEVVEISHF